MAEAKRPDFEAGDGIWLKKKSPKGIWQKRRFKILRGISPASNALAYYSSKTGFDNPLGAILLCNVLDTEIDKKDPTKFAIRVEGGRVFELQAEKEEDVIACLASFSHRFSASVSSPPALQPKLHDSEKSRKWWKPHIWREIILKEEYEKAYEEQQKKEAEPPDARSFAAAAIQSAQATLITTRTSVSRKIQVFNHVPTAVSAGSLEVFEATAAPLYMALYSKPRFSDDRSRLLSGSDDYVLTRQTDVIKIPGYLAGNDDTHAHATVDIRGELSEDFSVSLKLIFSKTPDELTPQMSRISYKFSVRYSASTPNPIYLVPDDGKNDPLKAMGDDQGFDPFASQSVPRMVTSVDPSKGHPGFRAESLSKAIEADEQKFFESLEAFFVAALSPTCKLDISHVYTDYVKDPSKPNGSPYVEKMLQHKYGITPQLQQMSEPEPNHQLIRAGRVGKYPEGLKDSSVEELKKIEQDLVLLEAKHTQQTAREKLNAAEQAKKEKKPSLASVAIAAKADANSKPPATPTSSSTPSSSSTDEKKDDTYAPPFSGKPEGAVSIVSFGDLLPLDTGFPWSGASPMIKKILERADIVLINLESIVRFLKLEEDNNKSTSFNPLMHQDCALEFVTKTLTSLEIDIKKCIFSLANNHAGDFDVEGIERTIGMIERVGGHVIGVSQDAQRNKRGQICKVVATFTDGTSITIGIVAWTKWMNHGSRRRVLPIFNENDVLGNEKDNKKDWQELKQKHGIDYLIGYVHWDYEHSYIPHPETTALSRRLLKKGYFDALVGHGPHVLQPVELFDRHMRARATPKQRSELLDVRGICAYSLGNLCSNRGTWPTKMGAVFELMVSAKTKAQAPLIAYKLVPFIQCWDTLSKEDKAKDGDRRRIVALDDLSVFSKSLNAYRHRLDDLYEAPYAVLKKFVEYRDCFRIRVRTSKQNGAGTKNCVFLSVKGENGVSEEWYLESPYDNVENFVPGREDTFFVGSVRELGDIQIVKMQLKPINVKSSLLEGIKNLRSTIGEIAKFDTTDSWHCDYVSVMRLADGKEWSFSVDRWVHPERAAFIGKPVDKIAKSDSPIVLLNDCADQMKTGDLICFESHSWYSDLTKSITKSKYSHVGLIVVEDEQDIRKELELMAGKTASAVGASKETKDNEQKALVEAVKKSGDTPRRKVVLSYESTRNGDHTPDITSGLDPYTGVHAFEIRQRVASYSGKLWWIPLKKPIEGRALKEMVDWLRANHSKRTPYDYSQMVGAGLDRLFAVFGTKNREDLSEMFCSEMVAAALRLANVIPQETAVSDATPSDCAGYACFDPSLRRVIL